MHVYILLIIRYGWLAITILKHGIYTQYMCKQMISSVLNVTFFYNTIATKLMLEGGEIFAGTTFILILFNVRYYPPNKYDLSYKCQFIGEEIIGDYKISNTSFRQTASNFMLNYLFPGSQCQINFIAVYHPYALDPGVTLTVYTYISR